MAKQSFEIGDKVRFISNKDSFGYDVGVGEIQEIFIDTIYDEDEDISIETGDELLQVYFPKVGMTLTAKDNKFILA